MPIRFFDPTEPSLQQQYTTRGQFQQYQRTVTPDYARQVTRMFSVNPTMRPGTGLALARAGVDPEGQLAQEAVKREAQRRTEEGFGWNKIGDLVSGGFGKLSAGVGAVAGGAYGAIKTVSRGADIGLQSIPQAAQGIFRERVADGDFTTGDYFSLPSIDNIREGFAQTDVAAANREIQKEGGYTGLLTGKTDADYGSGFFVGGDVAADAVQRRRAAAPLIDGHAVTLGRWTASRVFEPGSKPYGLASGLADLTVAIGADPSNWGGGGAARNAIRRGRTFAAPTADVVRETAGEAAELTPAAQTARDFGQGDIDAGTFLDRAQEFGSANPGVARIVSSLDEGLIDRDDAIENLDLMRSRIAVEIGLVEGRRRTVLSDVANDWLTMNAAGRRTVATIAQTTSVAKLRRVMKNVDVDTLRQLAVAKDENEVISVLGPKLGSQIRERPVISRTGARTATDQDGFRVSVSKAKDNSRWSKLQPHEKVDLDDLDDVVEQVDRMGSLVKMSQADRDSFVDRMAFTENRNERYDIFTKFMEKVQDDVLPASMDAPTRKSLTRLWKDGLEQNDAFRTYALNEVGDPLRVPGAPTVMVDGEVTALPSAHLLSEHIGQYMPLGDVRELARATSKTWRTLDKVKVKRGADALVGTADAANSVFKVGALGRLAYPIRVIGEEQIRMAASGQVSMFAHPLSYIALAMGRAGKLDINGDPFTESTKLAEALSQGSAGMFGAAGKVKAPGKFAVGRDDPDFARSLVDNLSEYHADAVARRVATGGLLDGDSAPAGLLGLDGIKDWFFDGSGKQIRQLLSTGKDTKGAPATRAEIFGRKSDPDDPLQSADGYVDSMVTRLKDATKEDPRLMEAISKGTIGGEPLSVQIKPGVFAPNPRAIAKVQEILNEGPEVGPMFAKGDIFLNPGSADPSFAKIGRAYDAGVERFFDVIMSKPTNFASRSPAFRQFYWERTSELIPYMQKEVQQAALDVARKSGLPKARLRSIEEAVRAGKTGELTAAEADQVAKAFGVDSTRKLLYDLHDRNNFFEAARIVFPFGNAWAEVGSTWARIGLKENPMALRRGQQVVTGLRNADTDGDEEGIFFTDANGEEAYAIPFSGWINEQYTGVPFQLNGSVQGLNIFGSSVLPGLGPVITTPLSKLLPERPEFQDFRTLLFPFGEPEYSDGALGGFAGSLMPNWAEKLVQAVTFNVEDDRVFANQVAYTTRYLLSTGKYSMSTAEEKDRLEQDAISAARNLHALRGLAQIWSPSAPSQEYVSLDKDGKGVLQVKMVERYQKLLDEDYKTAMPRFVEEFGMENVLTIVSRTSGGAPPTKESKNFAQENPATVRAHRDVYGYFLPRSGEYDYEFYKSQLSSGEREEISPREAMDIANQRLGRMVYAQYQAQVGPKPTAEQRQWLARAKEEIKKKYPGFGTTPSNLGKFERQIDGLLAAAEDPALSQTEAGKGLTLYLNYRTQVQQAAEQRGPETFQRAKKNADLREYLRNAAAKISEKYPEFAEMYEMTFQREMVADDDE